MCLKGCSGDKLAKPFGRSKVVEGCMNFCHGKMYVCHFFNEFNKILPGLLIPFVNSLWCFPVY